LLAGERERVTDKFKIKSAGRELLDYLDEHDVYHFQVEFLDNSWVVFLPITRGKYCTPHELTEIERATILPRLKRHLERKRHYSFFGRTYPAVFRFEPVSEEMHRRQLRASAYLEELDKARRG
jgi:hypothetical protein